MKFFEQYGSILKEFNSAIIHDMNPVESIIKFNKAAEEINKEWYEHNSHIHDKVLLGFHIKSPFIDTISDMRTGKKFSFKNFIMQEFNYFSNWNAFKRMDYNAEKFKEMCRMECIALLSKYGYINDYEFYYAMYAMLLKYFCVIANNEYDRICWVVDVKYVKSCIDEVRYSEIDLEKYLPYIGISETDFYLNLRHIENPQFDAIIPKSKEEIEDLFIRNTCLTTKAKYLALIDTYAAINSERAAQRVMQKFELSRKYKRKPVKNEEVMTNEEVTNEEVLDTVLERIDSLEDKIDETTELIQERFQKVINMMTKPLSNKEYNELIDNMEKSDKPLPVPPPNPIISPSFPPGESPVVTIEHKTNDLFKMDLAQKTNELFNM